MTRLDVELVERGLARSRSHAKDLIRSGKVRVNGSEVFKPALDVDPGADIRADDDPWVSRAAHKLIGALDQSGIDVAGKRVLDAGASTGGFTQVLLSRGAAEVYAVDVGHDQLAPSLRHDPRVHVREGLNLRHLTVDDVGSTPCDLVVGDVSFISLTLILEPVFSVLSPDAVALLLVKPQFEVGRSHLDSHGVVTDPQVRDQAVRAVIDHAAQLGWQCFWRSVSVVAGEKGNLEEFVALWKTAG